MDYKQIFLNLIEFDKMLQGWLDDMSSGELADENKSIDYNDGVYNALQKVQDEMNEYGLLFDYIDDDVFIEELDRLDDLNED